MLTVHEKAAAYDRIRDHLWGQAKSGVFRTWAIVVGFIREWEMDGPEGQPWQDADKE